MTDAMPWNMKRTPTACIKFRTPISSAMTMDRKQMKPAVKKYHTRMEWYISRF